MNLKKKFTTKVFLQIITILYRGNNLSKKKFTTFKLKDKFFFELKKVNNTSAKLLNLKKMKNFFLRFDSRLKDSLIIIFQF